jgi:hypothetical protein
MGSRFERANYPGQSAASSHSALRGMSFACADCTLVNTIFLIKKKPIHFGDLLKKATDKDVPSGRLKFALRAFLDKQVSLYNNSCLLESHAYGRQSINFYGTESAWGRRC